MSKLLKSKYNNSGDRCVDACLSYGELRYLDNEGSPLILRFLKINMKKQ